MTHHTSTLDDNLTVSAQVLADRCKGRTPRIALILGSGLNPLAEKLENPLVVPYHDIPFMKTSTAESHVGQFVCGSLAGRELICMQGRLHGYEGYTAQEVAYPVWLLKRIGIETLITTNAVGAINTEFSVGDFCVMTDHINFTGRNPVASLESAGFASRFFSMTDAYDPLLRDVALRVADDEAIALQQGVYLGLLGPSFETPAEIKMFRTWGADTVAMSVVEEVIAARQSSMRVLGISLVTNKAAGVEGSSPDGDEVLRVGNQHEADFLHLITGIVTHLS